MEEEAITKGKRLRQKGEDEKEQKTRNRRGRRWMRRMRWRTKRTRKVRLEVQKYFDPNWTPSIQ